MDFQNSIYVDNLSKGAKFKNDYPNKSTVMF